MKEIILVKNGELALKGLNRSSFEDILIKNMKRRLNDLGSFEFTKSQSTIMVDPLDEDIDLDDAVDIVSRVFGIAALSRACVCEKDFEDIKATALSYLKMSLRMQKPLRLRQSEATKNSL